MIKTKEFAERREKLFNKLADDSLVILYAGIAKKFSADEDYAFFANRNFYYLTGIEQEGSILVLLKSGGVKKTYLFIYPYDPVKEKRTGKRLTIDEVREKSGIENVLYLEAFDSQIGLFLDQKSEAAFAIRNLYIDLDREQKVGEDKYIENVRDALLANYPFLKLNDAFEPIMRLRMVKSPNEIEEFKEAVTKTNIGIKKLIQAIKPGLKEYQISSLFYYMIQDYDYSELSFPTIAASGVHTTTLHYPTPLDTLKDGDLILLDLGSRNQGYCADISRTFPINGKFTPLQKTIYSIVLGCNKMIVHEVKPGVTIAELQQKTIDYLADGCLKAGLIENKEEIRNYYFHNISHHIGLDTHDVSDRSLPLEAGNIISDEPGLYFKELGIGVRIEDDILVTEEGSYNLSGNILKEVDEVERAFALKKLQ
jgi:Xaa-Pro aminopeptidase